MIDRSTSPRKPGLWPDGGMYQSKARNSSANSTLPVKTKYRPMGMPPTNDVFLTHRAASTGENGNGSQGIGGELAGAVILSTNEPDAARRFRMTTDGKNRQYELPDFAAPRGRNEEVADGLPTSQALPSSGRGGLSADQQAISMRIGPDAAAFDRFIRRRCAAGATDPELLVVEGFKYLKRLDQ